MSCEACEAVQNKGGVYYYRWKYANIGFQCCEKHFMEIRAVLNAAQEK